VDGGERMTAVEIIQRAGQICREAQRIMNELRTIERGE
jgi:hypothetical protein